MDLKNRILTEPGSLLYMPKSRPSISAMAFHSHKFTLAFGLHDGDYPVNQDRFLYVQLKGQVPVGMEKKDF